MDILNNFPFIEGAIEEIVGPKPTEYYTQQLYKEIQKFDLQCQIIQISSSSNLPIRLFFVQKENHSQQRTCIVYLHGLSSYSFEGLHLLQSFHQEFSFCFYDLRGHGRDKHSSISYGIHQSHDLHKIIEKLSSKVMIKGFVLWGRSMGGAVCLKMLTNNPKLPYIKGLVLDSPFSSFQKMAVEIGSKNLKVPQFMAEVFVKIIMEKISHKYGFNLRQVDFTYLSTVLTPCILISSSSDEIISYSHTSQIIQHYGGPIQQIAMNCQHNEKRPKFILEKVRKQLIKMRPKNHLSCDKYVNKGATYRKTSMTPKKGLKITYEVQEFGLKKGSKNSSSTISLENKVEGEGLKKKGIQKRKKLMTSKQLIEENTRRDKLSNRVYY